MSNEPLALQKANELRDAVSDDSDVAEMVDTLATLLVLKQDMANPMYGAKVTFYEKPEGEWVGIDFDHYRDVTPNGDLLPDDREEAWEVASDTDNDWAFNRWDDQPWYVRWRRVDGDNNKTVPDGEIEHRFKRYYGYGEKQTVEHDEVPDPLSPDNSLAEDCDHAREMEESAEPGSQWHGEWMVYGEARRQYRFTPYVPVEEYVPRRAIVVEPHVADQPTGENFWDPNRGEYTTPDDYPMGTVNVVVPEDKDEEFGRDYTYEMRVETSVTPADVEPGETPAGHVYTPGWDDLDG